MLAMYDENKNLISYNVKRIQIIKKKLFFFDYLRKNVNPNGKTF